MLFERQRRPDDRQLRQFAIALVAFVTVVVVVRWSRTGFLSSRVLALAVAGWLAGAIGTIAPHRIEWLFAGATVVTRPIGRVMSELMLIALYFGIITPMALLARALGRDRLRRRFDRDARTYWSPRQQRNDPSRYFRQS